MSVNAESLTWYGVLQILILVCYGSWIQCLSDPAGLKSNSGGFCPTPLFTCSHSLLHSAQVMLHLFRLMFLQDTLVHLGVKIPYELLHEGVY